MRRTRKEQRFLQIEKESKKKRTHKMRNQTIKNESAVRHENVFSIDAAATKERNLYIHTH